MKLWKPLRTGIQKPMGGTDRMCVSKKGRAAMRMSKNKFAAMRMSKKFAAMRMSKNKFSKIFRK